MNAQFKNIPGLKTVDEVFKNIKEDIKSGNLNNKDRENSFGNFGDSDFDFGFDSDMFGGDDVVEFLDDESPVNQPPTIIDTMPLARAINSSTEATVTTMMAVADQQMAIETEKLLFNHRSSNAMLEGLTTINDNLATLVKFNSESTTQYHAASMKFYEEMTKMMEKTIKKRWVCTKMVWWKKSFISALRATKKPELHFYVMVEIPMEYLCTQKKSHRNMGLPI